MIRIVQATEEHARYVADHLRPGDKMELEHAGRTDFEAAVLESVRVSTFSFAALQDGVILCVFGLLPDSVLAARGRVWLLGTTHIHFAKKEFVKTCRIVVDEMLNICPVLYNAVDAQYPQAHRLLDFLGAKFIKKLTSTNGSPFILFEIRRKK